MLFIFVLVICLLYEPTLFDANCYSLKQDIFNTYKHSEKFINGSIRISCSKTLVLHFFSLLMYTQKTVYKIRLQHIIKVVCRELKKCKKQRAKNKYPIIKQRCLFASKSGRHSDTPIPSVCKYPLLNMELMLPMLLLNVLFSSSAKPAAAIHAVVNRSLQSTDYVTRRPVVAVDLIYNPLDAKLQRHSELFVYPTAPLVVAVWRIC